MILLEVLFKEQGEIESEIRRYLLYLHNKKIRESVAYIISAGGKRIRSSLLILAYKAVGGKNVDQVIPFAVAIELLHNWTLIHDDIIDGSNVRRNVPTVHVKWDKDVALLAGDALINLPYFILTKLKDINVDQKISNEIVGIIAETSLNIIDGEMMDVALENCVDITEKGYFEMAKKKTGSLTKSAVKIGAMLGTKDKRKIRALEEYGELIGIAFQIQDDLLDLTGDKAKLGKDIGRDIKEGKRTLIVIHTLANAPSNDTNRLMEILENKNPSVEDVREATSILNRNDSIKYAQKILRELATKAKSVLDVLPNTEYKNALLDLANFIINREF